MQQMRQQRTQPQMKQQTQLQMQQQMKLQTQQQQIQTQIFQEALQWQDPHLWKSLLMRLQKLLWKNIRVSA